MRVLLGSLGFAVGLAFVFWQTVVASPANPTTTKESRRPFRQCRISYIPTVAPNTASSDAIIAIALELEVGGVYFPRYLIAKSSRFRPRTLNSRERIHCWRR